MKTKIIAEIGINHNGDLGIAKKLIEEAANAGAHFVKFQKRNPDICVPEHQKNVLRDTPWGEMKYIDYKKKIEFGKKEYDYLYQIAKDNNVELFFSVWDEDSLSFALLYESDYIKIPSALCTDISLIKKAKESGRIIIISTGMTEWNDITKVVGTFKDNPDKLVLMHCISEYPAKKVYIDTITKLKSIHPHIGYSSHDVGYINSIVSIVLGATYIEKHFTIDKEMWGTDHKISDNTNDLISLIIQVKQIEQQRGIKYGILKAEIENKNKLRNK